MSGSQFVRVRGHNPNRNCSCHLVLVQCFRLPYSKIKLPLVTLFVNLLSRVVLVVLVFLDWISPCWFGFGGHWGSPSESSGCVWKGTRLWGSRRCLSTAARRSWKRWGWAHSKKCSGYLIPNGTSGVGLRYFRSLLRPLPLLLLVRIGYPFLLVMNVGFRCRSFRWGGQHPAKYHSRAWLLFP